MEDDFKLGVVIPYYKTGRIRETLMKELFELILSQIIYLDYVEVCIVEDGTNSTWLKQKQFDSIHTHYIGLDENKGISTARNTGIDFLKEYHHCNYYIFIDSDDYIDCDYFIKIYEAWKKEKRLYYFTDFEILDRIKPREGLKERVTGIVLHRSIFDEGARFDESIRYAEDVDFGNKYLRDKLTEPYYIDTIYHYNFGIDKKCLSYQAQLERGDRLND